MRCALSASTLSWNSRSNPLVTPSTTTREATPNTTPNVETVVKTEKVRRRNATTAVSPPRPHAGPRHRRGRARPSVGEREQAEPDDHQGHPDHEREPGPP